MEEQQRIERYLNNEMTKEERGLFEKEMEHDLDLAQKVAVNKEIIGFMESREPELEAKLEHLGDKYFQKKQPSKTFNRWWLLFPIFLILILSAWQFTFRENRPLKENANIEKTDDTQQLEKTPNNINPDSYREEAPKNEQQEKETPQKRSEPKNDQPIANNLNLKDFEPNVDLENLIKENLRSDIITRIKVPQPNQTFAFQESMNLKVVGFSNAKPPYQLLIYSNRPNDFNKDLPILSKDLKTRPINNKQYDFRFNAMVTIPQGLYYLIIKNVEEENILYISKFSVK